LPLLRAAKREVRESELAALRNARESELARRRGHKANKGFTVPGDEDLLPQSCALHVVAEVIPEPVGADA
jgi:hypothetical protein